MKYDGITRRHFLQGMGQFALALPFLPSLFARKVFAAPPPFVGKCFFAMGSEHGGIRDQDIFGSLLSYADVPHAGLSRYTYLSAGVDGSKSYPKHEFHYGELVNFLRTAAAVGETDDPDNGNPRLSYILGHKFNPYLSKMNLLRGIDLHFGDTGHHKGVYLGNFAAKQNGPTMPKVPSIDYLIAQSAKFYPNLSGVSRRQLVTGTGGTMSYDAAGAGLSSPGLYTTDLFAAIFGTPEGAAQADANSSIADSVLEDYKRFTSPASATGKRITTEDKHVLERFIDHINEIQRSLNSQTQCGTPTAPSKMKTMYNYGNHPNFWKIIADTIALSFACGACRVVTAFPDDRNLTRDTGFKDDYHHHIAHNHKTEFAVHRKFHRVATEEIFLQVIKALESYNGVLPGTTMLDQSLCTYQPMSGIQTHNPVNNLAITAGSANGFFNTGKYIDFRSLQNKGFSSGFHEMGGRPGIFLNQYFANILMSMGLGPEDYENQELFKGPGYGSWSLSTKVAQNNGHTGHPAELVNKSGQKLPIWTV